MGHTADLYSRSSTRIRPPHSRPDSVPSIVVSVWLILATSTALLAQIPSPAYLLSDWRATTPLSIERAYPAAVQVSGHLYVLGGSFRHDGGQLATVEHAAIRADGSLGSWEQTTSMTTTRELHAAVAAGGWIYVLGGYPDASVESAAIMPDGSLGLWRQTSSLTTPRYALAAVATNGFIYAIGGGSGGLSGCTTQVEVARVNGDGTLGAWQNTSPLNTPRGYHAAVAVDGFLYAIGGQNQGASSLATVEMAPVNADGTLGAWQPVTSMSTRRCNVAASAARGYIYAIGGSTCYGPGLHSTVECAKVNADGTLGPWQTVAPLVTARQKLSAAGEGGSYLYALGGKDDFNEGLRSVEYAAVGAAPSLRLSPAQLDFGEVLPGLSSHLTLSATNIGNAQLAISAIESSDLAFVVPSGPYSLRPGGTLPALVVSYLPAPPHGRRDGMVTIVSNDPAQPRTSVPVSAIVGNSRPVLQHIEDRAVPEGAVLAIAITATDPDEDDLTYSLIAPPAGTVLNGHTLVWTPDYDQAGTWPLRFSVADGVGGVDSATVVVTVVNVNRPPVLSVTGSKAVSEGSELIQVLRAEDADGDSLRFSVMGSPSGSGLTGNTFIWIPATGQAGSFPVTFAVSDGQGGSDSEAITLEVAVARRIPVLALLPETLSFGSVAVGETRTVTLLVSNEGMGDLRVLNIASSRPDVTVSRTWFAVGPGGEEGVSVTLQPFELGSFTGSLELQTDDPLRSTVQVPFRATVTAALGRPSLALEAPAISFGQVVLGGTAEFLLPVRNAGTAALTLSNAVSDNVQIVASPTSLSVPPQESRSLTVRYRPLPGMPLSGRLTLYSNDTAQPQVGVAWSALEVRSPYLSLTRMTPADGAFGISTTAEIQLVFNEPLYYRRGFTALDVAVTPEPLSGPVEEDLQVRGDGRTVVIPVSLARNTVYRVVVYGATGRSGLELFDMVEASFSTGTAPPVLAKVSGRVTEATGLAVSGSVYLMDSSHRLSAQASVAMDGSFEIAGVGEGSYTLYLDGAIADGRAATGSYDPNGDGVADILSVRAGIDQTGLMVAATVRSGTTPVVSSSLVAVDLDSSAGNQGQASQSGVAGDQAVVLEVYATAVEAWTGAAVTVAYDSTKVAFSGAAEGENLLRQNGGTALFLSHVDPTASTVEYGGAILGATATTAVSGSGLLGRFRFIALDGFSGESALRVTLVKVHTLTGRTDVEPNLTATLRSTGGGSTPVISTGPLTLDFNTADGDQGQTTGSGATAGKTYQVLVHAVGAPTINGWSAKIEYDPVQVRFVSGSFQPSTMVTGLMSLVEEKSSYVSIGGAVLGGSGTGSGSGLLGTATFEVMSGFTGSTELVIRQMSWKVVGSGEQMLTVEVRGTISAATAGLAGDFNDDGAVNFSDFFLFADAFGGSDPAYDLTADGAVNFSDFFVFADAFGTEARGKLMELAQQYLGLPAQAGLESAYPNPFNASTTIRYRLSEPGLVKLAVYNLTGQRVTILVDEWQEAGAHEVTWDGRAEDGVAAATGAYLIRLAGPGEVQVRKVTLLR